jgi:hydroxymethylpyrimidine kinase/phosphomethylpyrimidine kinase
MARSQAKRVALTIAGSDPGGGAGIQADLKTFAALGVYGYSAITEVIAQNSAMVGKIAVVAPAMIAAQIEMVARERRPDAIKIGALGNAAAVRVVARRIQELKLPAPVVDPVIVSSARVRLLDRAGERVLVSKLLQLARIVTPNVPEAEALTGMELNDDAQVRAAAKRLVEMGARAAIIKGGHRRGKESVDVMFDGRRFREFRAPKISGGGVHGTGCAFSAAIAAYLARGADLDTAVRGAKRYVTAAMRRAFRLGKGRPVPGHFVKR